MSLGTVVGRREGLELGTRSEGLSLGRWLGKATVGVSLGVLDMLGKRLGNVVGRNDGIVVGLVGRREGLALGTTLEGLSLGR